jgi:hypothetical protein
MAWCWVKAQGHLFLYFYPSVSRGLLLHPQREHAPCRGDKGPTMHLKSFCSRRSGSSCIAKKNVAFSQYRFSDIPGAGSVIVSGDSTKTKQDSFKVTALCLHIRLSVHPISSISLRHLKCNKTFTSWNFFGIRAAIWDVLLQVGSSRLLQLQM